jgi:rod shape-determining protein MreD
MIKSVPRILFNFVFLVLLQILVLNNIQLGGYINPYIYILFLLLLPFDTPGWLLLVLGFFLGLTIDAFSGTWGMHTIATTLLAFLRPQLLKVIAPREGYESGSSPRLFYYGLPWFIRYAVILVFAHHLALFYAEVFRFSDFFLTFFRVVVSTLFSSLLIITSQYLFYKR